MDKLDALMSSFLPLDGLCSFHLIHYNSKNFKSNSSTHIQIAHTLPPTKDKVLPRIERISWQEQRFNSECLTFPKSGKDWSRRSWRHLHNFNSLNKFKFDRNCALPRDVGKDTADLDTSYHMARVFFWLFDVQM